MIVVIAVALLLGFVTRALWDFDPRAGGFATAISLVILACLTARAGRTPKKGAP